jgi:hypothetical protein
MRREDRQEEEEGPPSPYSPWQLFILVVGDDDDDDDAPFVVVGNDDDDDDDDDDESNGCLSLMRLAMAKAAPKTTRSNIMVGGMGVINTSVYNGFGFVIKIRVGIPYVCNLSGIPVFGNHFCPSFPPQKKLTIFRPTTYNTVTRPTTQPPYRTQP